MSIKDYGLEKSLKLQQNETRNWHLSSKVHPQPASYVPIYPGTKQIHNIKWNMHFPEK
jgi:hypothetical protein